MCGNRCDFGGGYNYCDDEECNKGVGGYERERCRKNK